MSWHLDHILLCVCVCVCVCAHTFSYRIHTTCLNRQRQAEPIAEIPVTVIHMHARMWKYTHTVCTRTEIQIKNLSSNNRSPGDKSSLDFQHVKYLISRARSAENRPEAQPHEFQIASAAPNTTDNPRRGQRFAGDDESIGRVMFQYASEAQQDTKQSISLQFGLFRHLL